jgi:predicted metal-dependent phosphoesterase TrpH
MCASQQCRYDLRGSLWRRWDLHFHTPSSYDYRGPSINNQDIVDMLVGNGIQVVGVTDHHKIDVQRIQELQVLGNGNLTVPNAPMTVTSLSLYIT